MRRALLTMLFATVLLASGIGTATAEPQKNQIEVPATCDKGQSYTFVINAMSKTGHILGSTNNIVIKKGTATFVDQNGNQVGSEDIGHGNKKVLQGDLITCHGQTTTDLQGLGTVTAVFDFQGFITPRGK